MKSASSSRSSEFSDIVVLISEASRDSKNIEFLSQLVSCIREFILTGLKLLIFKHLRQQLANENYVLGKWFYEPM